MAASEVSIKGYSEASDGSRGPPEVAMGVSGAGKGDYGGPNVIFCVICWFLCHFSSDFCWFYLWATFIVVQLMLKTRCIRSFGGLVLGL